MQGDIEVSTVILAGFYSDSTSSPQSIHLQNGST